jgi:uncharacterized protein (TIGR00369 family)
MMSKSPSGNENLAHSTRFGIADYSVMSTMNGLEFMQKIASGALPAPPISRTMGLRLVEVEEGRVLFVGFPNAELLNPIGTVHGGFAATILDSALACCVHTRCAAGFASTTIEFKVNFTRPIKPDIGEVYCEGKTIHFGRTIATSQATLKDGAGKLLAHGTETCSIFSLP